MRSIPTQTDCLLNGDRATVFVLIHIKTPTPILATNCHRDLGFNDQVFKTDTGLLKVPFITQEFSVSASSVSITFSDSDDTYLAMALENNILHNQLDIHIAILDPETDELNHIIPSIYRGYLDDTKPGIHQVTFEFKNHMHKFSKAAGRRTNSASQNRFYPDDKGFEDLSNASGGIQL
jgi:hypothetical protein